MQTKLVRNHKFHPWGMLRAKKTYIGVMKIKVRRSSQKMTPKSHFFHRFFSLGHYSWSHMLEIGQKITNYTLLGMPGGLELLKMPKLKNCEKVTFWVIFWGVG